MVKESKEVKLLKQVHREVLNSIVSKLSEPTNLALFSRTIKQNKGQLTVNITGKLSDGYECTLTIKQTI
jgi:16S rRNA U1498 N3-methylase RsmE